MLPCRWLIRSLLTNWRISREPTMRGNSCNAWSTRFCGSIHCGGFPHGESHLSENRACDDFAAHALGGIEQYATTLLNLAEEMTRRHKLRLGLAVMRSTNLAHRLAAMQRSAGNNRCKATRPARWAIGCTMVMVTMLLAGLSVGRVVAKEDQAAASHLTVTELVRRMQQTVDKARSYDIYLQADHKWPLKTVIAPCQRSPRPRSSRDV